ncbi:MAG: hypothetical protein ACRCZS_16800, partial [Chroococcidiopsis sp.]
MWTQTATADILPAPHLSMTAWGSQANHCPFKSPLLRSYTIMFQSRILEYPVPSRLPLMTGSLGVLLYFKSTFPNAL